MEKSPYILTVETAGGLSAQAAYSAMVDALTPLGKVFRATLRPEDAADGLGGAVLPLTRMLAALSQEGVDTLTVQPLMLLRGRFYGQMLDTLLAYCHLFRSLRVGLPLLCAPEDAAAIAAAIKNALAGQFQAERLILMAHGTPAGNGLYAPLEQALGEHSRVGVLTGEPSVYTLSRQLHEENVHRVCLAPCLLTAGKHGREDLARWAEYFHGEGFLTETVSISLGLLPETRRLLRGHALAAEELPAGKGVTP